MARQGGAFRGDAEENRSPAAHAAFRPLFVIVRGDEQQVGEVAAGGHFLPVVSDHLLGAGDLFPGRQQPFAIKKRPPVELAGGQLNVIGFQLNAQLDNFIELVDVVPVENEVEHHRVVARFHGFGHGQLLLEGFFVAGQRGVEHFIAGLEANLDMVQPGLAEGVQFALRQPYPGGDQVGIEPEVARGADQFRQIFTGQRLAAGKAQLNAAHRPRLAKDLDPLFGGQLLILPGEVQRIGTLQRAAVGQLRQQPQWRIDGGFTLAHGR